MATFTLLYVGDVVAKIGRQFLSTHLPRLIKQHNISLVLANAENSATGVGVTRESIADMQSAGVHAFSSGDHLWDKKEILPFLESADMPLVRPANFPKSAPGKEFLVVPVPGTEPVLLINLMGRVFTGDLVDCPFQKIDLLLNQCTPTSYSAIVVDFHAEATAEKQALAFHLDGRATVQVGTHTHVATADARIFPKGLGYVTDLGMTGPYEDAVIGSHYENVLFAYRSGTHTKRWETGRGKCLLNAVLFTIDADTRKTVAVERLDVIES